MVLMYHALAVSMTIRRDIHHRSCVRFARGTHSLASPGSVRVSCRVGRERHLVGKWITMISQEPLTRRVELWLKRGDQLRRPTSRQFVTEQDFKEQRKPGVAYLIYEWVPGTYSDGNGGRSLWQRA
jgi:hypothetical protein